MTTITGLSQHEVVAQRERGNSNDLELTTSRSVSDILRQNVFTLLNSVLFMIGIALVALGRGNDALLSVGLIFVNIVIAVYQEVKAKRQLDQIALLTRPCVTVVREGQEQQIDPSEIVIGDTLAVYPGDQIVVDGTVIDDGRAEVDESLLTGESDLIPKQEGDTLLSGSFCVTGHLLYRAEKVGEESFANQLTMTARQFQVVQTPLQRDVNLVIRFLMLITLLMTFLLLVSTVVSGKGISPVQMAQTVAVVTGLIPYGLFFMVIVFYAAGAVKIARLGALIQQMNAVESLSNVNVLCLDKTGTLTTNRLHYHTLYPLQQEGAEVKRLLGHFIHSVSVTNQTSEAIQAGVDGQVGQPVAEVAFSSARKWSALAFNDDELRGVFVLGATEMLQPHLLPNAELCEQVQKWSHEGYRVLLFAYNPNVIFLHDQAGQPTLPPLEPLGLVALTDELRPEAKKTLKEFAKSGIHLKIISGDNPQTVASLAKQAGLPRNLQALSGTALKKMTAKQFEQAVEEVTVFGRITPQQKEQLVDALLKQGYYVAMIGDGVNDVLSLKKAHLGIAMQSGSNATRGVADMVLLNDSFATLLPAFLEGQRIIHGMRDILRLFLTRIFSSALLIVAIMMAGMGFPYTPAHAALTFLTVGIPPFMLALWARPSQSKIGLLPSVVHFVIPASVTIMLFGVIVYALGYSSGLERLGPIAIAPDQMENILVINDDPKAVAQAIGRTAMSIFTTLAGLLLVIFVEPPTPFFSGGDELSGDWRPTQLAITLIIIFFVILAVEPLRNYFELLNLGFLNVMFISAFTLIWAFVTHYVWRERWFQRFLHLE